MIPREAHFKPNDRVYEKAALKLGIVIEVYEFERTFRYVVKFDDGTEGVFFEHDLERL